MKHQSPFSRLVPAPHGAFTLSDSFWKPRLDALCEVTLPGQYRAMESTGRIDNFRRAAGELDAPHQGYVFNDSDVYKWLEAAARAGDHPAYADGKTNLIRLLLASQQPDGYLNTAFMFDKAKKRWANIRDEHELYCAGHFIEAALALSEAGGDDLLPAALKLADLICVLFGPEAAGKRPAVPGHAEIEIALAALYRATGLRRYIEQARYFVDARGQKLIGGLPYHQDHMPFRELEKMTGHAVRALYLNIAAADIYLEMGDVSLLQTLERLWERLYARQVYITGGLGARHSGEAFGEDFELPNEKAYSETCAAVAAVRWNSRMLQITGAARFADVIETTLFNAALAGISLAGDRYFYTNPLSSEGTHRRAQYFNCACCPPNIARLLAGLPDLFFSTGEGGIWVHQYAVGRFAADLDGQAIRLDVETRYPADGIVRIRVDTSGEYALHVRVPGWAGSAKIFVNGDPAVDAAPGYAEVARKWQAGDIVVIEFPLSPRFVSAHPSVLENTGRVALLYGPLVYCVESAEPHPDRLRVATNAPVRVEDTGAWPVLTLQADLVPPDAAWANALYRTKSQETGAVQRISVKAVPYFTWANADPMPMRVWLREI